MPFPDEQVYYLYKSSPCFFESYLFSIQWRTTWKWNYTHTQTQSSNSCAQKIITQNKNYNDDEKNLNFLVCASHIRRPCRFLHQFKLLRSIQQHLDLTCVYTEILMIVIILWRHHYQCKNIKFTRIVQRFKNWDRCKLISEGEKAMI